MNEEDHDRVDRRNRDVRRTRVAESYPDDLSDGRRDHLPERRSRPRHESSRRNRPLTAYDLCLRKFHVLNTESDKLSERKKMKLHKLLVPLMKKLCPKAHVPMPNCNPAYYPNPYQQQHPQYSAPSPYAYPPPAAPPPAYPPPHAYHHPGYPPPNHYPPPYYPPPGYQHHAAPTHHHSSSAAPGATCDSSPGHGHTYGHSREHPPSMPQQHTSRYNRQPSPEAYVVRESSHIDHSNHANIPADCAHDTFTDTKQTFSKQTQLAKPYHRVQVTSHAPVVSEDRKRNIPSASEYERIRIPRTPSPTGEYVQFENRTPSPQGAPQLPDLMHPDLTDPNKDIVKNELKLRSALQNLDMCISDMFAKICGSESQTLTAENFQSYFHSIGESLSGEGAEQLIDKYDTNQSASLLLIEFQKMVTSLLGPDYIQKLNTKHLSSLKTDGYSNQQQRLMKFLLTTLEGDNLPFSKLWLKLLRHSPDSKLDVKSFSLALVKEYDANVQVQDLRDLCKNFESEFEGLSRASFTKMMSTARSL